LAALVVVRLWPFWFGIGFDDAEIKNMQNEEEISG